MLRQVQNSGVVSQCFEILLRLTIFKFAYLGLCEAEPPSQKLLIERLAEQLKMPRVIPIRLENLTDMLALKGRPKFIRLKEFIPELGRRCAKLVALLPVTPAAQARGVVCGEH
jgi:hypothetical protein